MSAAAATGIFSYDEFVAHTEEASAGSSSLTAATTTTTTTAASYGIGGGFAGSASSAAHGNAMSAEQRAVADYLADIELLKVSKTTTKNRERALAKNMTKTLARSWASWSLVMAAFPRECTGQRASFGPA